MELTAAAGVGVVKSSDHGVAKQYVNAVVMKHRDIFGVECFEHRKKLHLI